METIIAGVATIPSREAALRDMLASVCGQVDRVHVCLNGYVAYLRGLPPNVLQYKGLRDIGDVGKFYGLYPIDDVPPQSYYYLSLDDDLIYPPDYVERMIQGIERYDRKAVCTFHGRCFLSAPVSSYYRHHPRKQYRCLGRVAADVQVHVGGTGVMGWHTATLYPATDDFPVPNMADVHMARLCKEEDVPQVCLAHEEGWIIHSDKIDRRQTIHHRQMFSDHEQTRITNEARLYEPVAFELNGVNDETQRVLSG